MGNESSNTKQRNQPATIIKPILKKPNVYPTNYMNEPFYYYYPVYPTEYNESESIVKKKPVEKAKDHCNHNHRHHHHQHHHHHRHQHRHQIDRACQTTPSLLLGADGIVDKPRYTPAFLRESSTSSESSDEEHTSASVIQPSAQKSHSSIKVDQTTSANIVKPASSVVVKRSITPMVIENQHPSATIIRSTILSPPANDPKTISQPVSAMTINGSTIKS